MSEEIKEEKSVNVNITETESKDIKILDQQRIIMAAIVVVIIALVAGIGIYNTPKNRLTRQLTMGQKYLQEQQYEEAIVAFEQAIATDERCVEAYLGEIEAYQRLGDVEDLKAFYDKALAVVEKLEGEELIENMSYVVSIYLAADEVHSDDTEKTVEILKAGYQLTGENEGIKAELTEIYITLAKTYVEKGTYEEALRMYDWLLELDSENIKILSDLENCLILYLDFLMENEEYEKIRWLNDKYGNIVRGVNFQTYFSRIEEKKKAEEEAARKAEEARKKAEEEAARKAEEARKKAEDEAAKKAEEERKNRFDNLSEVEKLEICKSKAITYVTQETACTVTGVSATENDANSWNIVVSISEDAGRITFYINKADGKGFVANYNGRWMADGNNHDVPVALGANVDFSE